MKRAKQKFIFSLAILLLLCACDNNLLNGNLNDSLNNPPFGSGETEAAQSLPGTGGVFITFNSEDFLLGENDYSSETARTILPGAVTLTKYKLVFYEKGGAAPISGLGGNFDSSSPVSVIIPVGDYDLVVYGYESETYLSSDYYSAMGKANDINITENNTASVSVELKVIDDEGEGAFVYTITYSGSTAQITIDPLGVKSNESSQKTITSITSGSIGSLTLYSGYYRIIIEAENSGKKAVRSEVLHIYRNLTSSVTHTFDSADFFTALTGSVNITGASVPEETLTANVTGLNASTSDIRYIWYSDSAYAGTGSSYPVKESDLTKIISVTAIAAGYNDSKTGTVTIVPFEGDGDAVKPYLIRNEWQLRYLAAQVNSAYAALRDAHYLMMNNITVSQGNWTRIGNDNDLNNYRFLGRFNGNGFTISGIKIVTGSDMGMFGAVGSLGVIENLNLINADVTGTRYVGALVGFNLGLINNCSVQGEVNGSGSGREIGGLVGYNFGNVTNSSFNGDVGGNEYIGGLIGYNGNGTNVTNNSFNGIVSGDQIIGGIIGYNDSGSNVTDNTSNGDVSGNDYIGGIVGYNKSNVVNSSFDGDVSGNEYIGGIIGYNASGNNVTNSSFDGSVSGNQIIGGLIGYNGNGSNVTDNTSNADVSGNEHIGGIVGYNVGNVTNSSFDGSVSGGKKIGGISGINFSVIQNCNAKVIINGEEDTGGIVGYNASGGNVTNSSSDGSVSGGKKIGGISGINFDVIQNCYAKVIINGEEDAGGIAGTNYNKIENCFANGTVTVIEYAGGIAGYNAVNTDSTGNIQNCYFIGNVNGNVNGNKVMGGIVGLNAGITKNCFAAGEVTGGTLIGGIAGFNADIGIMRENIALNSLVAVSDVNEGFVGRIAFNNGGQLINNYAFTNMNVKYNWNNISGLDRSLDKGLNELDSADLSAAQIKTQGVWSAANFAFGASSAFPWVWEAGKMPRLYWETSGRDWPDYLINEAINIIIEPFGDAGLSFNGLANNKITLSSSESSKTITITNFSQYQSVKWLWNGLELSTSASLELSKAGIPILNQTGNFYINVMVTKDGKQYSESFLVEVTN